MLAGFLSSAACAAPVPVASVDRTTWPEALNTPALFDVASRAEILTFAHALAQSERLDQTALAARLGLRQINLVSINSVRQALWQRLWHNYDAAQQSCAQDASFCFAIDDLPSLREQAARFEIGADSFYAGWAQAGRVFHESYLDELLRKAALFPQISSEVARFSDLERNGDELNDRLFLLTFEAGPSAGDGSTDGLTDYLRRQKMNAVFFVLGNSVQVRRETTSLQALGALYKGQCVGVQGWQYRSHGQWKDWQASVLRSVAQVQGDLPENFVPLFRPPYGQRRADAQPFFSSQQLQVVLWDIDAQDNNNQINAQQAGERVLSLMLLWRRGVIQLHDSQASAQTILPWLLKQTAQSGIGWEDCRDFARRR
nr:polysaccharide deacetylase family protein [Pseudomonas sp. R5(2019)]